MTLENPNSSGRLQSTTVVMIAPLWDINATSPALGETGSNVALIPWCGIMIPRQFGPVILIPCLRAISTTLSSRTAPSPPISRNPAVTMTARRTPFSPHSSITPGTSRAGTAMTAQSTGPGISTTEG